MSQQPPSVRISILVALCLVMPRLAGAVAADTVELLQQQCDGGSGEACYKLSFRYRDGVGVAKDPSRMLALQRKACEVRFDRACFSTCLAGLPTCFSYNREVYNMVAVLLAEDPGQRRSRVATADSVSFLWLFVREAQYHEILSLPDYQSLREAAEARIVDIARSDPDPRKRAAVIPDIFTPIPPEVLREIARNDPDPNVRKDAKERLANDLATVSSAGDAGELVRMLESPDAETRRAAVQNVNDPARLADLAERDPDREVRYLAVNRLTDHADVSQAVLARIAEKDKDERVRSSAAALVTDATVLQRLLRTSRVTSVRRHALENLEDKPVDPSLLLWVAENDSDDDLRREATFRLADQGVLARLARSSTSPQVRATATAKLKDQKLLGEIAIRDPSDWVYVVAIRTLTDEAILGEVARRRPEDYVQQLVARKATDQAVLVWIATAAKEWLTRAIAIGRITDTKALGAIAETDTVPMAREAARRRLAELQASEER
jgi:hypothetical protein